MSRFVGNDKASAAVLGLFEEKRARRATTLKAPEASFELLGSACARANTSLFLNSIISRVEVEKAARAAASTTEATVKKLRGRRCNARPMWAKATGPVNALDNALRKCLEKFYPSLKEITLTDYKVRVVNASAGTAAKVRVMIESRDHKHEWTTMGVSTATSSKRPIWHWSMLSNTNSSKTAPDLVLVIFSTKNRDQKHASIRPILMSNSFSLSPVAD